MKIYLVLAAFLASLAGSLQAQSTAIEQRLAIKYTPEQISDMQSHDPGKYQSLAWWVSQSYQILDKGQLRYPNDAEILAIDIFELDINRALEETISIKLPADGKSISLKSGNQCWEELKQVLEPAQWTAMHNRFLSNKAFVKSQQSPKSAN